MTDFHSHQNFHNDDARHERVFHGLRVDDNRVEWAGVVLVLLALGGVIAAMTWTPADLQTASRPETTGSRGPVDFDPGWSNTVPVVPRQLH